MDDITQSEKSDIICNNINQELFFSVMLKATAFESSQNPKGTARKLLFAICTILKNALSSNNNNIKGGLKYVLVLISILISQFFRVKELIILRSSLASSIETLRIFN